MLGLLKLDNRTVETDVLEVSLRTKIARIQLAFAAVTLYRRACQTNSIPRNLEEDNQTLYGAKTFNNAIDTGISREEIRLNIDNSNPKGFFYFTRATDKDIFLPDATALEFQSPREKRSALAYLRLHQCFLLWVGLHADDDSMYSDLRLFHVPTLTLDEIKTIVSGNFRGIVFDFGKVSPKTATGD
jgi:hypothetical protein